jgi:putative ABC transport system permease protein
VQAELHLAVLQAWITARAMTRTSVVIPVEAWSGGIAAALVIGALAGLMPAVRASRMPATVALRTA